MKDLIAIDLILPTTTLHFFGPRPASASSSSSRHHTTHPKRHKLRGKLRIVTSKPIKLRQVQIKFKGFTHLSWRDRCRNGGAPAGSAAALGASLGLMSERMEAWKTLRKSKQILLEDATLPAGVTDLGFEMSVPGHLPHSYLSEFLEVGYAIVAKMTPQGKFGKPVRVERPIEILKTLMPKDVSCGYVNGYQVPTVYMSGQRESTGIRWKFNVPKFVCLDDEKGVEFVGAFFKSKKPPPGVDDRHLGTNEQGGEVELKIERILVDIIQEELYRLCPTDTPEQATNDIASFLFPTNNPPKRQLVTPQTHPSTYLHPPWSCPIHFSFPFLPPAPTTVGPSKTTRTGPLTYTLDSPFLRVSHFVRLRVDFSNPENNPPLCLGLPVNVTRRIHREEVAEAGGADPEGLPSYSSVVRDGERLPDYTVDGENDDEHGGIWSEEEEDGPFYPTTIRRVEAIQVTGAAQDHQLFMTGAGGSQSESGFISPLGNGSDSDTDPIVTHIEPMLTLTHEPGVATAPPASSSSAARRRRATEEIINRLPSAPTPSVQPSVTSTSSSRRSRRDTEIAVHERSMTDFFEIRRSGSKRQSTTGRLPERAGTSGGSSSSRGQTRPILRSRSTGELRGAALLGSGATIATNSVSGRPRGGTNALTGTSQSISSATALFHSMTTS